MESSDVSLGLTRRKFINLSLQGTAALGVGTPLLTALGCQEAAAKTIHGACYHDCPDTCSWKTTVENGKVTKFAASTDNLYTNGKLCNKLENFPNEVTFHPDRILTPMKRVGAKGEGKFEPISWEQALQEVADKLKTVIQEKGAEAVLPYHFAGTQGKIQGNAISNRFFARLGATKLERLICGHTAEVGVLAANGKTTGVLPEDIIHSRYIMCWGTNTVVSNQHLWPFIEEARRQGAKLVVIDPFQSQTAQQADWHVQPMPGTDTALALAMMHVILSESLQDQDYVDRYTVGVEELRKHVERYTPEKVATLTGLEPDLIKKLAREYAGASPSLIRVLVGLEHQANGGSAFRAIAMLPALTGAWKEFGGGLMHYTFELFGEALNWERLSFHETIPRKSTRIVSMIQIGRALNDPELQPAIHALLVYNSNPAVIAPDQNQVIKGLKRDDLFTVVLEHFMTDTARYADYVFPATTQLEHWDIQDSWGQPYLNLNEPAIEPQGQSRPNSEFFRLLAKEMGYAEEYLYESDVDIIKKTLDSSHEYLRGISFDSLRKTGWAKLNLPDKWMPHAEGNFGTPSGKCEFYSTSQKEAGGTLMPEYQPVSYSAEERAKYPLQLLTIKSSRNFLNSSHANVGRLRGAEGKPVLQIHSKDAKARGISEGESIQVFNQYGEVTITASIRDKVRPGVVSMSQGYWKSLVKGGSTANALTPDLLTDMGRGAAFHEARVEVVKKA
jgi:anaerobic selenocysteine-containing dehydrogenase